MYSGSTSDYPSGFSGYATLIVASSVQLLIGTRMEGFWVRGLSGDGWSAWKSITLT